MPLGESIDDGVINQIKAREALFSANERTADQLKYLNSRNAWVRVISFVNKDRTPTLSKNFVLSGVPSSYTGESFTQYSGVDFTLEGSNPNSFYKTTNDFGTRPRPGITSFNVKSKNSGGTIQVAEIGFVVWNEDDLDTIEKLYLRLGFEVMVEWGHTVYIRSSEDNYGKLEEYVDGDYNKFFENTVNEETVRNHIKGNDTELGIRRRTDYNAEAFLGYITNFSWNFRQDGGYECSIKVISTGAVIESLLGNVGSSEKSELFISDYNFSDFHTLYNLIRPVSITNEDERQDVVLATAAENEPAPEESSPEESNSTNVRFRDIAWLTVSPVLSRVFSTDDVTRAAGSAVRAIGNTVLTPKFQERGDTLVKFNTLVEVVNNTNQETSLEQVEIYTLESGQNLYNELNLEFNNFFTDTSVFAFAPKVYSVEQYEQLSKFTRTKEDFNLYPVFMPLRYCLALINIVIKKQNRESSVIFDVKSEEKFLDSKNLVVVKPLKTCILLRRYVTAVGSVRPLQFNDAAIKAGYNIKHSEEPLVEDEILNILVNLEVFVRNIDSLIESNTDVNEISLFPLLTNVLEEINESVSYGIDLGIAFDEDTGKFKIIDRNNLPGSKSNNNEAKTIEISGTSTTVSSLSLTSKVTNKLGNQISIAAQTDPGSYPASVIKYREWNDDLTTRLKRVNIGGTTGISSDSAKTVTSDQRLTHFEKLTNYYRLLNDFNIYNSENWKSISARSQTITQEGIDYDPDIPKGLIPIELSFTMDGIAGLKVLQTFKIPDRLLPKKYKNDLVGFIINGIEHTIQNNRWFTHIRAQMYLFRRTVLTTRRYSDIFFIDKEFDGYVSTITIYPTGEFRYLTFTRALSPGNPSGQNFSLPDGVPFFRNTGISELPQLTTVEQQELYEKIQDFLNAPFTQQRLIDDIKSRNFKYPHIILAQAIHETGRYRSNIFKTNNNLFGMRLPRVRPTYAVGENNGFAVFTHWRESVRDRRLYDTRLMDRFSSEEEYYDYLDTIYAPPEDSDLNIGYSNSLKNYISNEDLKKYFASPSNDVGFDEQIQQAIQNFLDLFK